MNIHDALHQFLGTDSPSTHGPVNKPEAPTPPVPGISVSSRTQWQVVSVHNDGQLERLGKDNYERSNVFDHYDDVQAALSMLLAKDAVTSVRVSTRQVTNWTAEETLTKKWITTRV